MDFFELAATAEGGEKFRGYKPKHTDPLVRDKANFLSGVEDQIEMIKTGVGAKTNRQGNLAGNMFEKLPSGAYRMTLKNGISVLKVVPNKEFFDMPNAEKAIEFLIAAAKTSQEGKFDAEFKRTARVVKAKKGAGPSVIEAIKANGASAQA